MQGRECPKCGKVRAPTMNGCDCNAEGRFPNPYIPSVPVTRYCPMCGRMIIGITAICDCSKHNNCFNMQQNIGL